MPHSEILFQQTEFKAGPDLYPDPVSIKEARKTTVSGGVYSLVAYLPVMHEVLSFIPKTAKIGHGDPYL